MEDYQEVLVQYTTIDIIDGTARVNVLETFQIFGTSTDPKIKAIKQLFDSMPEDKNGSQISNNPSA